MYITRCRVKYCIVVYVKKMFTVSIILFIISATSVQLKLSLGIAERVHQVISVVTCFEESGCRFQPVIYSLGMCVCTVL